MKQSVRIVTETATLNGSEDVIVFNSASNINFNMGVAHGDARSFRLKNIGTGNVTVLPSTDETINDAASVTLYPTKSCTIIDYIIDKWMVEDYNEDVITDTISEQTAATGVTIDGVKLKDSEVYTDTINEKTSATGVTIDGVKLKDKGIEMSGAMTDHGLYIHPSSWTSGKRAIRIGDYGTEFPLVAGDGIIRTYAKVTSGTDISALQFHWGITECAGGLIGSQSQMESAYGTPGPDTIMVQDCIAGLQAGKYLASGAGDLTKGMFGGRYKVYSNVTSVCNGNVAALWLDSQMSCAVAGTEASIFAATGGTKPDAFAWLTTTSGGWEQLFYLDSTMAAKEPFVATGCSVTVASVPYLKVKVNATQYGIPLIAI